MKSRLLLQVSVVGVVLAISMAAHADTITYDDQIPMQPTNWSVVVTIPKFDPALIPGFDPVLGSLDAIEFTLTGSLQGRAGFENRDSSPATVTLELDAIIRLKRPDNSDIWFSVPNASRTETVDAFDSIIDFDGPSGRTYNDLVDSMTSSVVSISPSDLALFYGPGNILLPVTAKGLTSASGAGNLVLFFETAASAKVEVTYHYTIPEPATLILLGMGSIVLLGRRRIRHFRSRF